MARRSRLCRIAKWSGVALSLLMAAAWPLGGIWSAYYSGSGWMVCVAEGAVGIVLKPMTGRLTGFRYVRRTGGEMEYLPQFGSSSGGSAFFASCPLWIPMLAGVASTAYLFYRDRRYPPGLCQKCGYDLQGNVSGVCPECGRVISNAT